MAGEYVWRGRVIQEGQPVATVIAANKRDMLRELHHYAAMYSLDGEIILETRAGKNKWRRHEL